jgi:GNAT superfamily N-acetyltransferase
MYAKDHLGQGRENPALPLDQQYVAGFDAIDADPNQLLLVVEDAGAVVGTMQITFIAGIARLGVWRAQLEAVRVHESRRGLGLGREMFEWAIAECRRRGCGLVQIKSDNSKPDAQRFYETLGFSASHVSSKLTL